MDSLAIIVQTGKNTNALYNPATVVRALHATGLYSWPVIALDLVSGRANTNAPLPGRVMDWATGRRPLPAWAEREAGRLLMRCWRNDVDVAPVDGDRLAKCVWFAGAYSPVYAAYLNLLAAGVAYTSLASLDHAIGALMKQRFGLTSYPGKAGARVIGFTDERR